MDNWSGSKLQERLKNQLAGDYLRDGDGRCGVMLLVWQGKERQNWEIDDKMIGIADLQENLQEYWDKKIAIFFPKISNIKIIVIDLTLREFKSSS